MNKKLKFMLVILAVLLSSIIVVVLLVHVFFPKKDVNNYESHCLRATKAAEEFNRHYALIQDLDTKEFLIGLADIAPKIKYWQEEVKNCDFYLALNQSEKYKKIADSYARVTQIDAQVNLLLSQREPDQAAEDIYFLKDSVSELQNINEK
jgi:hypothetical protein